MRLIVMLLWLLPLPLWAQIYADFTVSQGANSLGTFRVRLDYDKAPRTCANFIGLATGQRAWIDVTTGEVKEGVPYYDGLTFHRLIHNFMIQGGSRDGSGFVGPGYSIQDEFHADLRHSGRYMMSMAKSSLPGSGGAQFFITLEATRHLDDKHAVFGEVIDGREIIDGFTSAEDFPTYDDPLTDEVENYPVTPIVIDSVVISGPDLAGFDIQNPALKLPTLTNGPTIIPSFDKAAGIFTMTYNRAPQTRYRFYYSFGLSDWIMPKAPLWDFTSMTAVNDHQFSINGLESAESFFVRMPTIDYGLLVDAPSNLKANGRTLTLEDRSSNSVTLTFDGASSGTWTDSSGGSGNLSGVIWDDYMTSGTYPYEGNVISIGRLRLSFNVPAGAGAWTDLDVYLSFHDSLSGYCDGGALVSPSGSTSVLDRFTLSASP